MRSESKSGSSIATTFAKIDRVGETGESRSDFDRNTSSIVKNSPLESPAIRVPDPVCKWAVDNSDPAEHEEHSRTNSSSFASSTDEDSRDQGSKLRLINRVDDSWDFVVCTWNRLL